MNNILFSGHVGQEPTIKDFESGSKIARFSLAVKNPYQPKAEPMWINVKAWGMNAERVMSLISTGREVIVQGSLTLEEYKSQKDGKTYIKPVVNLEKLTVCGPRPKAQDAPAPKEPKSKKTAKKAA